MQSTCVFSGYKYNYYWKRFSIQTHYQEILPKDPVVRKINFDKNYVFELSVLNFTTKERVSFLGYCIVYNKHCAPSKHRSFSYPDQKCTAF